ncbi:FAD-dependent oxidoreductase [Nonomuraea soli]|uniref:2-polyprenyl-6-methoxyphenol hydroxylase-like FAD-dependent oxidoreductase n=1 Tax=Nonomuraea soli TaxID=1032476 RepID=A0A7W0HNR1_9ACTN|nr:FAD-dependent monooxygenase [Nonomuraea soli]MBA2890079.1 2-polyprenyl-6-methoxyphenol hydroxylase-like FAD-dependent oxidoreductase [Nonomuraea soli]
MNIVIIGAGIGGLCLAQGLNRAGIPATVYERGYGQGQGWRVSIKDEGSQALHACLPEELFNEIRADALLPASRLVFTDHLLNPKFSKPIPPVEGHFGISRQRLRDLLKTGLDVRFGQQCVGFAGNTAHFADGSTATGDLLVGADGTRSVIRAQLLPEAAFEDLGTALYGVTPFTTLDGVPEVLVHTFNRITDPAGTAMAIATCRPGDYFTWTITPADGAIDGWHPAVRRIVAEARTTFPVRLRSALPIEPWHDPHVTLLGDAIHTMTPGRGDGANTALHDARLLTTVLSEVAAGRVPLGPAKQLYEQEMLWYGFAAVATSRSTPFTPRTGSPQGPRL